MPAIVEIAPNVKIICNPSNSYGSFIVYAKWPEYAELKFISSILNEGDTYVDVGAHIGDSSLLAAKKVKTGIVIACEPTPEIYNELVANVRLNNFEGTIVPVQKAISDRIGTSFFSLESESEINHISLKKIAGISIKVATTTIDFLYKEYQLKKITLLKIDVEGFELEVLKGAKNSLNSKKIEMILFEVNPSVIGIKDKVEQIQIQLDASQFIYYTFTVEGLLIRVPHLYILENTGNFLAVSIQKERSASFQKCLN